MRARRSEMELGYGSEYQLFRCLGHHRHEFDGLIRSSLGIHRASCIDWLDFPADHSRRSGDGEWKSIQCFRCRLQMSEYERIEEKWRGYWPSVNMAMNWDAVFRAADVWYFVEAKAHVSEMESKGCGARDGSLAMIRNALDQAREGLFSGRAAKPWYGGAADLSYQLANRLAFLWFCQGIAKVDARIVYLEFLNGYNSGDLDLSVRNNREWDEVWKEQWKRLGIPENLGNEKVSRISIDCKKIGMDARHR